MQKEILNIFPMHTNMKADAPCPAKTKQTDNAYCEYTAMSMHINTLEEIENSPYQLHHNECSHI